MTAYHPLDTLLAWLEGIFVGMADVATTLDWENCKLPVVAETMKRIGQCACGDKAYSIPEETKSRVETQFWYAHSVNSLHDFCLFVFVAHTRCAGTGAQTDICLTNSDKKQAHIITYLLQHFTNSAK